ncbi:MAG: DUF3160 domain-containing protein [Acidobacteriia bacterium]|nr:DUF3160 domain-containing protein [Terriglobia bacterium]
MNRKGMIYVLAGCVLVLAIAATFYFIKRSSRPGGATGTNQASGSSPVSRPSDSHDAPPASGGPEDIALTVTNFLGGLTPGGTAESAGHERNYVVTYQVAFLRETPDGKLPEESLSYKELQDRDVDLACFFYGENVFGTSDPAHPGSVAVRSIMHGKEPRKGFVDSAKLWLEPPLDRAGSERYMILKETAAVRVVPDPASPSVLDLLQGEVVDTVGQLNFQGKDWIKARFNGPEVPRYGFIPANDVKALTAASVNESVVAVDEIPKKIRSSRYVFSPADRQKLSQNGFYIAPMPPSQRIDVDDLADSYSDESSHQIFITSDLFLHSFHLIFDRMLQDIEEQKLLPAVSDMAEALAAAAEKQTRSAAPSSPAVHDALLSDLLYFSVAARLFNSEFKVPEAVRPQAEVILAHIQSASGELPSQQNFLGFDKEDFTQYKVRGHYEKNDALKQYFRGMMWFGRRNFLLSNDKQTLAAILLPYIVETAHETRRFEAVDGVATYLVGRQDKYTLAGYRSVNRKVFGMESPSPGQLPSALDQRIAAFKSAAWGDLPQPQIVSVQTGLGLSQEERLHQSAGLKFLGQRYVLDAFLLQQLTSPSVGSDQNPRNLPSALDVMMVLGSRAATELQQQAQKQHQWANYDRQMDKLKQTTESRLAQRSTFYEEWLYALKTLFMPTSSRQMFALSGPWQYKTLNTGLASWTELKHDTILYAEQSAAEMGGGGVFEIPPYDPPGPKGYVEPNPALFRQLMRSVDEMMGQLKRTDFITEEYEDKFTLFRKLAQRAEAIAQKEVAGELISRDDYEWIRNTDYSFDRTLLLPRSVEVRDPAELQMALVADVATDAVSGQVLEEGIGTPQRMFVVVKDASGGTRLTVGFVYSWYEFAAGKRWSDLEWKGPIYSGDENAKKRQGITPPAWYATFKGAGE